MPRNSGGIYSLPPVYLATPGETIMTEQHNAPLEDIANGLTESLPRSGSAPMTGDLKMGGQKITGLGAPVADTDAARKVDVSGVPASETVAGKVELATAAETITGTDTTRAVHPAGAAAAIDAAIDAAISDLGLGAGATMPVADQALAEAGTNNTSLMTPLRTRQAIEANLPSSPNLNIGNLSGSTAIVGLEDVAKLLLVAKGAGSGSSGTTISASIGYQRTTNGGSSWGSIVYIATSTIVSNGVSVTALAAGAEIVDMVGYNGIRLSGAGATGAAIIVESV